MRVYTQEYVFHVVGRNIIHLGLPEDDGSLTLTNAQFTEMKTRIRDEGYVLVEMHLEDQFFIYGRVFDIPADVLDQSPLWYIT